MCKEGWAQKENSVTVSCFCFTIVSFNQTLHWPPAVPKLFGSREQFHGRQFVMEEGDITETEVPGRESLGPAPGTYSEFTHKH